MIGHTQSHPQRTPKACLPFWRHGSLLTILTIVWLFGCEPERPAGISFLTWSPDGKHLASVFEKRIFIAEACELGTVRVFDQVDAAEEYLAWSPDSRNVAYASTAAGSWDIWLLLVEKGEKRPLTRHPAKEHRPLWSPTGKGLYFVSWRSGRPDIWYLDIQSNKEYPITSDDMEESALSLSRDGHRLCYMAEDAEGRRGLYVLDLQAQQRLCLSEPTRHLREAVLSPTGEQAAYLDDLGLHIIEVKFNPNASKPALLKLKDILLVQQSASKKEPVTPLLSNVSWSPTGKEVAYLHSGRVQVASMGPMGRIRPLTLSPGGDSLPTWSPCDSRVAYVAGVQAEHPVVAIVNWEKTTRDWLVGDLAGAAAAARYCLAVNSVDEALRLLDEAIRRSPETGPSRQDAIELLSSIYFKTGRYDRLLSIHREVTKDYVALGLVHMFCFREFDRARLNFEKVATRSEEASRYLQFLNEYPSSTLRLFCSAELAKRRGQYEKAAREMEAFLRAAPTSPLAESVAFDLGDLYALHLRQPEKALAAYAEALRRYPQSILASSARRNRARILWKNFRQPADAAHELRELVNKLDPDERLQCLQEISEIWLEAANVRAATSADWALIAELIQQDRASKDQTPSQIAFREEKRLNVFLESQRRAIAKKDLPLAIANAARLPELHLRSSEVKPLALPRLLAVFDEAGFLHEGNAVLANPAMRPYIHFGLDSTLPYWLKVLTHAPKDVLIEARLGELPAAIVDRLRFLVEYLEANPRRPDTLALAAMLRMAIAHSPEEVIKIDASLPKPVPAQKGQSNPLLIARVTSAYILGNYYQTLGHIKEALEYYERMLFLMKDDPALQEFGAATVIFSKCRTLLDKELPAVRRWLDIERRAGQTIWGVFDLINQPADRSREYADFLVEYPDSPLADDAYYRLATLGQERYREGYYRKLLTTFPKSPLFHAAFRDLEEFYAKNGNEWLAVLFADELKKRCDQTINIAFLELEQGRIYAEHLRRPDLAAPHLQTVLQKHPNSPEWAEAKKIQSDMAYSAKRWTEALSCAQELVKTRPHFDWVAEGDALLRMAQCKEKLNRWIDAEKDYVQLILGYRDRLDVLTGKMLAEKFDKLTNAAKLEIYQAHPEDFLKILPALKPNQLEDLVKLLPGFKDLIDKGKT